MEMRQLRYFVAVGEEQHYGRAAQRLRVAQPALSRQIQNLEHEIGFELFERLPRRVKITDAGKFFLNAARRALQEVNGATARAKRIASGQSGTLRVAFVDGLSWHGIVPDSLRYFREHQPDAELQIKPLSSLEQIAGIQSGSLDAGYAFITASTAAGNLHELAQLKVGVVNLLLAVPKGHALTKLKNLRLRDLVDTPFIWFPRRINPVVYDRMMTLCARGGLKVPRIVQETEFETALLSMVSCRIGVAFVSSASRWRCPAGVTLLPVRDFNLPLPFALFWRKDNNSPLLAKFTADVKSLVERTARESEVLG